jgi:hypothetical protein
LQARLAVVLHYLPLAAEKAEEEVEYVHLLRVWTRRAAAALKLYASLLPRRRRAWIKKQLKRLRCAATDARDCDVLVRRLAEDHTHPEAESWADKVRAQRAEAQKPILAINERHRTREFHGVASAAQGRPQLKEEKELQSTYACTMIVCLVSPGKIPHAAGAARVPSHGGASAALVADRGDSPPRRLRLPRPSCAG